MRQGDLHLVANDGTHALALHERGGVLAAILRAVRGADERESAVELHDLAHDAVFFLHATSLVL